MDQIQEGLDRFIALLKDSEAYKNYEHHKQLLAADPELKRKVDDFRRRNFFFHNSSDGDRIFDESDRVIQEMEEIRKDPRVDEFLKVELAYCKMIQDILKYFSNVMFADFE